MPAFYHVANILMVILFALLTRRQVKGRQNVPRKGPLILVSNHLNNADIPLLAISFPRGIVYMAKEELFRSPGGWAVKAYGAFPVRRGVVDRNTLRIANQVLKDGKVLGVYPEGTRSRNGRLQTARPGAVLIAQESQSLLLPVGIYGSEKMRGSFWWLHRPRVVVNIGKPFTLPAASDKRTKEELALHTTYIMQHIARLLPPEYRGVYAESHQPQLNSTDIAPVPLKGDNLGG